MKERLPLIILFMALCAVLGISLWVVGRPYPFLTKDENDIDNTIIGDSATDDQSGVKGEGTGPAYMSANWSWPMPLALWNPNTSFSQ